MTTSPAPKNANTMATSRMRSVVTPSWSRMITETGDSLRLTSGTSRIAMVSVTQEDQPEHGCRRHRGHDGTGDGAEGVLGLLGQVGRRVESDERRQPHDHGEHQPAADAEVLRRVGGDACEMRLSVEPVPVMSTATIRATANTTTISSSRPTATELILATTRVEAMARMACRASVTRGDHPRGARVTTDEKTDEGRWRDGWRYRQ